MNMNSGYSGWAMSNRAREAYENGEMPKSKWTKAAILGGIAEVIDGEYTELPEGFVEFLGAMTKQELFDEFVEWTSWHHTSKFANATDFYEINEYNVYHAVDEFANFAEQIKGERAARKIKKQLMVEGLGVHDASTRARYFAEFGKDVFLNTNVSSALLFKLSRKLRGEN